MIRPAVSPGARPRRRTNQIVDCCRGSEDLNLDDELVSRYVDVNGDRRSPEERANARLRNYGVPVWALVGQWRAVDEDVDQVAQDYELPREAVEAALAYYRRNKKYIDARLLLNSA